jgi:hypothetical protein
MNKLQAIINSGEYEKIEGWCTVEKALKMASLIKPTDFCVELGVWGGRSLLPICCMTKNKVIGIDAWSKQSSLEGKNDKENDIWWSKIDYDKMFEYTKSILSKYGCVNARLIRCKSKDVSNMFLDESIDFLHQDSNHSELISCEEVELYHKKVKKNGIWVFDDTDWETTIKAQKLLENYGYKEIYNSGKWKIYRKLNINN